MYMKPTPPCPTCFGDQKVHGKHESWQDCQREMTNEDLRSPARRYRPRSSGTAATGWGGHERREYS